MALPPDGLLRVSPNPASYFCDSYAAESVIVADFDLGSYFSGKGLRCQPISATITCCQSYESHLIFYHNSTDHDQTAYCDYIAASQWTVIDNTYCTATRVYYPFIVENSTERVLHIAFIPHGQAKNSYAEGESEVILNLFVQTK